MPKENDYPNMPSPFLLDLDAVKRDKQKAEGILSQAADISDNGSSSYVTMDGGIPTDSLE